MRLGLGLGGPRKMQMELTRKSVGVWADFGAELTLKSVQDGLILLGTNTQICTSRKH